jgi:hypothetical protein
VFLRFSAREAAVQRFVEVYDHNDAGLDRNAEQRDVADPYCHAEVVAQQFLQDEAARECIECRGMSTADSATEWKTI